jgi:hypothetical protein
VLCFARAMRGGQPAPAGWAGGSGPPLHNRNCSKTRCEQFRSAGAELRPGVKAYGVFVGTLLYTEPIEAQPASRFATEAFPKTETPRSARAGRRPSLRNRTSSKYKPELVHSPPSRTLRAGLSPALIASRAGARTGSTANRWAQKKILGDVSFAFITDPRISQY